MPVINSTLPESIREYLSYDPLTGHFHWIKQPNLRIKTGAVAGSPSLNGYLQIQFNSKRYYSHRLAWYFINNCWPENEIDHTNGIRTDNRISNLRTASKSENARNSSIRNDNKSGLVGVYWSNSKNYWAVATKIKGKDIWIGCYSDFFEACCARKSAEIKYNFHPNHGKSGTIKYCIEE